MSILDKINSFLIINKLIRIFKSVYLTCFIVIISVLSQIFINIEINLLDGFRTDDFN